MALLALQPTSLTIEHVCWPHCLLPGDGPVSRPTSSRNASHITAAIPDSAAFRASISSFVSPLRNTPSARVSATSRPACAPFRASSITWASAARYRGPRWPMPTSPTMGESTLTSLKCLSALPVRCTPASRSASISTTRYTPWTPPPLTSVSRCCRGHASAPPKPRSRCIPCLTYVAQSLRLLRFLDGKLADVKIVDVITPRARVLLCHGSSLR